MGPGGGKGGECLTNWGGGCSWLMGELLEW